MIPFFMDIPRMLWQIAEGKLAEAIATVKQDIALRRECGRAIASCAGCRGQQ